MSSSFSGSMFREKSDPSHDITMSIKCQRLMISIIFFLYFTTFTNINVSRMCLSQNLQKFLPFFFVRIRNFYGYFMATTIHSHIFGILSLIHVLLFVTSCRKFCYTSCPIVCYHSKQMKVCMIHIESFFIQQQISFGSLDDVFACGFRFFLFMALHGMKRN